MAAPVGNKFGANRKEWQSAIKRALARKAGTVAAGLDKIASDLVDEAYAGDKEARREIWDRVDGKAAQTVDTSLTIRDERAMSDAELAAIAAGVSGDGTSEAAGDSSLTH
ncbi:MAG TPA: hypothetical protein VJM31_08725 [Vicinamibacterales bacterium]|nr:hypothetical protein [Vicinamibacterales bacterium]